MSYSDGKKGKRNEEKQVYAAKMMMAKIMMMTFDDFDEALASSTKSTTWFRRFSYSRRI